MCDLQAHGTIFCHFCSESRKWLEKRRPSDSFFPLEGKGATLEQQLDAVVELARNTFSPLTTKTSSELDFVGGLADWTIHLDRKHSNYCLDGQTTYTGKPALLITLQECQGFVELKHEDILADPYRGCRIRLLAYLKTEDV